MANNKNFIAKNGVSTGDGYAMPDVRPSLLLDFANSKALDPRITFTRGSTATYWDGHTTTKGEENLIAYSEQFENPYWLIGNEASITANSTTAPDGTTTADTLTGSAVSTWHGIYYGLGNVTDFPYQYSVYAKAGTEDFLQLRTNSTPSGFCNFNLSTGAVGNSSVMTGTITDVGNGWYRCSVEVTTGGISTWSIDILDSDINARAPANTPTGNIYIWGAQLEQRDSITAYTSTSGSPIVKYQPTLQTAASGEARFDHDPVTGESKGLLIEEARTNLNSYSGSFTLGYSTADASKFYDYGIAPDGTQSAVKVAIDYGQTTPKGMTRNLGTTANTIHTSSCYVKSSGYRYLTFWVDNGAGIGRHIQIDGTDGSVTNVYSNAGSSFDADSFSHSVTDAGNGWYRIAITYKPLTGTGTINHRWYGADTSGSADYGNGSLSSAAPGQLGWLVWGVQKEVGEFPTSYIATSGSTVTRSRDEAEIVIDASSDWYANEGTLYGKFSMGAFVTSQAPLSLYRTTGGNDWMGFYSSTPQSDGTSAISVTAYRATPSGSNNAGGSIKTVSGGSTSKYFAVGEVIQAAMSFSTTEYNSGGAGAIQNETGDFLIPQHDRLSLWKLYNGGFDAKSSHMRKAAFYPKLMTQQQLEELTEE